MVLSSLNNSDIFNFNGSTFWLAIVTINKHSTKRAIKVAMAAPTTPSAGAPNNPKINVTFKIPFVASPIKLPHIGNTVFPMLRSAPAYTNEIDVAK